MKTTSAIACVFVDVGGVLLTNEWDHHARRRAVAKFRLDWARFKSHLPWAVAFSFARAIQQPALELWKGQEANVEAAQQALYRRARCNRASRRGEYQAAMERTWKWDALKAA